MPVNTSSRRTGSSLDLGKNSVSDMCPTRSIQAVAHSPISGRRLTWGQKIAYRLPATMSRSGGTSEQSDAFQRGRREGLTSY